MSCDVGNLFENHRNLVSNKIIKEHFFIVYNKNPSRY